MEQPEEKRTSRVRRIGVIAIVVLCLAALGVAVYVVVRGTKRMAPVEVPKHLVPAAPDTSLVRFRRGTRNRLKKLERRFARFRDTIVEFTPEQESLVCFIDSGFVAIRADLAIIDTLSQSASRVEFAREIKQDYIDLKKSVYRFSRSYIESVPELDPDSLDQELQKVLSE